MDVIHPFYSLYWKRGPLEKLMVSESNEIPTDRRSLTFSVLLVDIKGLVSEDGIS